MTYVSVITFCVCVEENVHLLAVLCRPQQQPVLVNKKARCHVCRQLDQFNVSARTHTVKMAKTTKQKCDKI